MERFFLTVICASVVLLTTAFGLASPLVNYDFMQRLPLLLRIVPSGPSGYAELSHGQAGGPAGSTSACRIDLDDLAGDDLANGSSRSTRLRDRRVGGELSSTRGPDKRFCASAAN